MDSVAKTGSRRTPSPKSTMSCRVFISRKFRLNFESVRVYWLNCSLLIVSAKKLTKSGSMNMKSDEGIDMSVERFAKEFWKSLSHSFLRRVIMGSKFLEVVSDA